MPLAWIPRRLTITRLCTRSNNSSNSSNFNNIPPSCIWLITCNTTINCKFFREIEDRRNRLPSAVRGNRKWKNRGGLCSRCDGTMILRQASSRSSYRALPPISLLAMLCPSSRSSFLRISSRAVKGQGERHLYSLRKVRSCPRSLNRTICFHRRVDGCDRCRDDNRPQGNVPIL